MKMMFKAFAKKLFGAKYERLTRTLPVCLIVFWGLYLADFQIQIAPFILYLMISIFTAGVMWQALSSEDNAANMQNMLMLPFERWKFVVSYIVALGTYTFLTKTVMLLAIVLAVSVWNWAEILTSILCAMNAILMTASIFFLKKYFRFRFQSRFQEGKRRRTLKSHKHYSVWRYFFRYLKAHTNYLMNTVVIWCVACVLPLFFKQQDVLFAVPIGFAILSLNTPIGILLSCDPALEQAVRFLPGQKKAFCVPYCLFIFLCNIVADIIFLCSWQVQIGNVTVLMIATAVFFALQSAICSVLLEWFYPIRGWKIESDLWHHPRKYIVPAVMLLLAGLLAL